jgi:hypothetical protein
VSATIRQYSEEDKLRKSILTHLGFATNGLENLGKTKESKEARILFDNLLRDTKNINLKLLYDAIGWGD